MKEICDEAKGEEDEGDLLRKQQGWQRKIYILFQCGSGACKGWEKGASD